MKENKTERVEIRLTLSEKEKLLRLSKNYKTVSDFIKDSIFLKNRTVGDPVQYLEQLDHIAYLFKKTGNNINQIAHYINKQHKLGIMGNNFIAEYNKLLSEYIEVQKKFIAVHKKNIN